MILGYTLASVAQKLLAGKTIRQYTLPEKQAIKEITGYSGVIVAEEDKGINGAAFMALTFEKLDYSLRGVPQPTIKSLYLPVAIVTVNFTKIIETTIMQSQTHRGTVKQFINFGDYDVTIDFILSNDNNKYPFDKLKQATEMEQAPVKFGVVSKILNAKNINNLVIKSGGFRQTEYKNLIHYQWQCLSDEAYEIQVKRQKSIIG